MQYTTDKDRSQIRILVIEDEDYARECISDFLELVGFCALQAKNGREGVELFGKHRPDVVITDIRMPEMDGFEILKFVQAYSAETPVIVISGTNSLDDVAQCLKLGAWDYIVKPVYDYSVLEMSVLRALEKKQLLEENRRYREYLEEEVIKRSDALLNNSVKQEREGLKARSEAAQTAELVRALVGGIAHDFNNVLTALSGYASMLQTDAADAGAPLSGCVEKITEITAKGRDLTAGLVSLTKTLSEEGAAPGSDKNHSASAGAPTDSDMFFEAVAAYIRDRAGG